MSTTDTPTPDAGNATGTGGQQQGQTFTQVDVDRIVNERLAREKAKFADYDQLKAAAEGAKTVEQKLSELEAKYTGAETRALRSDIAAKHGISPEDRDLFLTGTDEATLTAQAKRLADREADRKKHGNVAPREGGTTRTGDDDSELRTFAQQLFASAD